MRPQPRQPVEEANYSARNPVREAMVLAAGLFAAGVVFVAATVFLMDLLIPHIPVSWERKVFSNFLIFQKEDSTKKPEETAALEDLLERLASHWGDNPYDLRVGVLDSEQVNALAFPGGRILVTAGLLEKVQSENELAFVLGHEMGHFRNRDHLRSLGRGVAIALVMAAIQGSGGTAAELLELGGGLSSRKFDREQELAADAFGLDLVYQEYGHVTSALDFFDRLPDPEGEVDQAFHSYLSTHPIHEDRVQKLISLADENDWPMHEPVRPLWN